MPVLHPESRTRGPAVAPNAWQHAGHRQTLAATPDEDRAVDGDVGRLDLFRLLVQGAPPWLLSTIIHMAFLIVLAVLTLPRVVSPSIEIEVRQVAEPVVELDAGDFQLDVDVQAEATLPVLSADLPLPTPEPVARIDLPDLDLLKVIEPLDPVRDALVGRQQAPLKQRLLVQYGGTELTETAVRRGLEWLARNQLSDGSWSLSRRYSQGSSVENRCAATAMALLAFMGAGNTHQSGEFQDQVSRGKQALLSMQNERGDFYETQRPYESHHHLYSQAQATMAICELFGMTQDAELLKPAQLALDYAAKIQAREGGWRYVPNQQSDTSVTGWFVMALQSGRMAGLQVSPAALENVSRYLDSVQHVDGSRYAYTQRKDVSPAMTAEALLCRQYLGWSQDDRRLVAGVKYLLGNRIRWAKSKTNTYYWYYATQVIHHMEGDYWKQWNAVMSRVLPKNQLLEGKERGSWSPQGDHWGQRGGRLYMTCMCLYMLEVYYRHLPIYQHRYNGAS